MTTTESWTPKRQFFVVTVASAVVAALIAAMFWPSNSSARKFANGTALAKILIQRAAENNNLAELSGLGGKVCVHPEGIFSESSVTGLFPGFPIAYLDIDMSSGYWFTIIGIDTTRKVEVYGIPQSVLLWTTPKNVPFRSLITCPSELTIVKDAGTVVLAQGAKRVAAIVSIK